MISSGRPSDIKSSCFVPASTHLNEVRVAVEGLHGATLTAAQAAATFLQSASSLGDLETRLHDVAAKLDERNVTIEVSPGSSRGAIFILLRQPVGWKASSRAVLSCPSQGSVITAQLQAATSPESVVPLQFALGCEADLGHDALKLRLTAAPLLHSRARLPGWTSPALEFEVGCAGLAKILNVHQTQSQGMAVSLKDSSGRHQFTLKAQAHDLFPGASALPVSLRLRSSIASLQYSLNSHSEDVATGYGKHHTLGLEISSSLFGDVSVMRAEANLQRFGRLQFGGSWYVSAGFGVVAPLAKFLQSQGRADVDTPWQERFFLGGTVGQGPGERFPGFAAHGVGPVSCRPEENVATSTPASPASPRKLYRFGRGWATETIWSSAASKPGSSVFAMKYDNNGGDARAKAEVGLRWPLSLTVLGAKPQVFAFCALGSVTDKVRPTLLQDMLSEFRASVGCGIGVPISCGGMVGISWSHPISARSTDLLQPWQLSLSFGTS